MAKTTRGVSTWARSIVTSPQRPVSLLREWKHYSLIMMENFPLQSGADHICPRFSVGFVKTPQPAPPQSTQAVPVNQSSPVAPARKDKQS
ncbi:hypothetical protein [Salinisphaera sp. G21_0]|uniref:hypothetical protein n=1 Tax=Salinisphaera sp. G21_0 TaxID=2821094 RepID=UPI001AD9828D|nr:hypothetical protein [Salinisphaera sp. G21_0]MBO9484275.1 hypothetical protein [Salinisphaera sp. G21_0]